MVSLRYHVVSLAAVLFALAGGLVVGSAAVGPALAPAATPRVVTSGADEFASAVAPALVEGSLAGRRVLVLLAPDARAAGVSDQLTQAGATVTGQLRLRPALFAAGGGPVVDDLVSQVVPAGLELPETGPLARAGAVLAAALTTSSRGTDSTMTERQEVLGGFSAAGLLAGPAPTGRATLVLVLAGRGRGAGLAGLADAFVERVGVVVAGPALAARPDGALAVLRGRAGAVSDVDGVDTAEGLVVTILALAEQAGGGVGHYGHQAGASRVAPDLS